MGMKMKKDGNSFYVAKPILHNIHKSKEHVEKGDQDRVFVVDGREGSGKSTLALQLAYSVDNTLSLDRVVFTANDFEAALRKADKYQAVVFDEAFNGLSSAGALSKQNKQLVRLLMEVRQRNLFIFIVLPSIFLLEKYVGVFRSQSLFHVYQIKGEIKKRKYKVYNYGKKKQLYIKGKKEMSYYYPKITKNHRFYGKYPPTIDAKEYLKKKHDAFGKDEEVPKEERSVYYDRWAQLLIHFKVEGGYTQTSYAQYLQKYFDWAPSQVQVGRLEARYLNIKL